MKEKVECPYCGDWYDEDWAYEHQCKEHMAEIKTMQNLAAMFPDIYRKHKLLCYAQKEAGSVVITVIDKHNNSFQVTGGTAEKAHENLVYWVKAHEAIVEGDNQCES